MSDNKQIGYQVTAKAVDDSIGMTVGELRSYTSATAHLEVPDEAHVKVRVVGMRGQIKSIEVTK